MPQETRPQGEKVLVSNTGKLGCAHSKRDTAAAEAILCCSIHLRQSVKGKGVSLGKALRTLAC